MYITYDKTLCICIQHPGFWVVEHKAWKIFQLFKSKLVFIFNTEISNEILIF